MSFRSYLYLVVGVGLIALGGFMLNEWDFGGIWIGVAGVFCVAAAVLREKG